MVHALFEDKSTGSFDFVFIWNLIICIMCKVCYNIVKFNIYY